MNGMQAVIAGRFAERRLQQDARWGGAEHDDTHDSFDWASYLEKQVEEIFQMSEGGPEPYTDQAYADRLVDIGALAMAALESLCRKRDEEETRIRDLYRSPIGDRETFARELLAQQQEASRSQWL